MDAFENLIAMLLRRDGYWTTTCLKVELTKEEKKRINLPSSPRWELDVVAYRGSTNEILVVECKSFLDSGGVDYRNDSFVAPKRYKLFTNDLLRKTVLGRLAVQLVEYGFVRKNPTVQLCLAAGHIASKCERSSMERRFAKQGWKLFDADWIRQHLNNAAESRYENDIAHVVAKLLARGSANAAKHK